MRAGRAKGNFIKALELIIIASSFMLPEDQNTAACAAGGTFNDRPDAAARSIALRSPAEMSALSWLNQTTSWTLECTITVFLLS